MYPYEHDPDAIYRESFRRVRTAVDLTAFDERLHPLIIRLVHACGLPEIARNFAAGFDILEAAHTALKTGAPIFADAEMVAAGVTRKSLPANNTVKCLLNDERTSDLAKQKATTRSAAAVDLWGDQMGGAIVAIGNAPTALFRVLEIIEAGGPKPAAIFGMPVGFVGAAESKEDLVRIALDQSIPFATIQGQFGGSAVASAAVNAAARPNHSGAIS